MFSIAPKQVKFYHFNMVIFQWLYAMMQCKSNIKNMLIFQNILWWLHHPGRISFETSHLSLNTTFKLQCIIAEHSSCMDWTTKPCPSNTPKTIITNEENLQRLWWNNASMTHGEHLGLWTRIIASTTNYFAAFLLRKHKPNVTSVMILWVVSCRPR